MKITNLFFFVFIITSSLSFTYNAKHMKIFLVREPYNYWNEWRRKNPMVRPDLSNSIIKNYSFGNNFTKVNFKYSKISDCTICGVDFSGSNFSYSVIERCEVPGPSLGHFQPIFKNVIFFKAKIISTRFYETKFSNVKFNQVELYNCQFESSYFKNVSFVKAKIIGSNFFYNIYDNFFNIDFSYSKIIRTKIFTFPYINGKIFNVKFNNSIIEASTIAGTMVNISFFNAVLTGSSFYYFKEPQGSTLINVNFTNANLTNVNFHKATFKNVVFNNADMRGAKVSRKYYNYIKRQGVRNFNKIKWID